MCDLQEQKPLWLLNIADKLEGMCNILDEKIEKEQQQLKASKKKTEQETRLALEMKLNMELSEQLAELNRRHNELNRVNATFETLTIADNDQKRLENAKEMYKLGKELTGIRFDYKACTESPNLVKGYIKSVPRKMLQPFELPAGDIEALWALVQSTAGSDLRDKENKPNN